MIKMVDGKAVKVSMLLLDPLYGTDAMILGRTYEIVDKQTGKTKTFKMFKLVLPHPPQHRRRSSPQARQLRARARPARDRARRDGSAVAGAPPNRVPLRRATG
ncbi:MAG TPA: hypothetical protein VGD80_16865 [Kofleriaceae bacterium]